MYVSTSQVLISLERLNDLHPFFGFAFFGFKKADVPIGQTDFFSYTSIRDSILDRYYRPVEEYDGYFSPFKSNKRWVSSRYDSTSLQRIVADTFGDAFIHKKGSSKWGWKPDYIDTLVGLMERHQSSPIPLLDMAVWLYKDDPEIPHGPQASSYLLRKVIKEFKFTLEEIDALCVPQRGRTVDVSDEPADLN